MDKREKLKREIKELKKEQELELKEIGKYHYGGIGEGPLDLEGIKYLDEGLYKHFRQNLFYYRIAIKFKEKKLKELDNGSK